MKKINLLWIAILFLLGIATGYFGKKYLAKKERNQANLCRRIDRPRAKTKKPHQTVGFLIILRREA